MPARLGDGQVRQRIVDAATRCLTSGEGELTTREVIAVAGVSTGTLYHYFHSLDLLLLAVAEQAAAAQPDAFTSPTGARGLAELLGQLFSSERADTVLPWLRHRAIKDDALREGLRRYDEQVRDWLVAALDELPAGVIRRGVDGPAAVEVIRCLAEGYQLRLRSGTLGIGPDRFLAVLIELIRRGWAPGLPA